MMKFVLPLLCLLSGTLLAQIDASQLVVVLVPNENANIGQLYKFEQSESGWTQIGPSHSITVGANGIAWAKSDLTPKDALIKQEGDKRSPAGVFPLGQTFGRADKLNAQYLQMPYEQIGPNAQCIEDNQSAFYNQIVFDNTKVTPDWKQDDRMLREDELYDWGIFVEHNTSKTPGDGSCIFIHIWRGEGKPTAGCTAMSKQHITQLVYWLDQAKAPYMVLLTKSAYDQLRSKFDFPEIK